MRRRDTWCLVVGVVLLAGCSRQPTSNCEPAERYSTAGSAPPVQVPDDLSPPNESDALRLPPAAGASDTSADGCLESPPPFSDSARRDRGSESDVPTETPAAEPESADGDRVIEN
jgi:uncharacterized lipoprotein